MARRAPAKTAMLPLRYATVPLLLVLTLSASAADGPPPAPSVPAADVLHGTTVQDPYRNLEDLTDPATRAWLLAQGQYTAAQLARIDVREAILHRLETLTRDSGDIVRSIRRMPGGRIYYLVRKAGDPQFKLAMREGLDGPERLLVDPQALSQATGVPHAINHYSPSWDGRTLAYGVSSGGSEMASLHLVDIASGRQLREPIPRVVAGANWAPDSRHLAFNQLRALAYEAPDTETYLDTTVYLLDCEHPNDPARPLFGPLVNKSLKLDRLDVASLEFSPDSRWMLARTTDTTALEGKLFIAPLSQLTRESIDWQPISSVTDKITDAQLRGDTLYIKSHAGAPRSRVLALPLKAPDLAKAKVVVPEPRVGVLTDFKLGPEGLIYTEVRAGFNTRVRRHGRGAARDGVDIAPRQPGSTFLVDDPAHAYRDVLLSTSTWTAPQQVINVKSDGTVRVTSLRNNKRPPGAPDVEVREVDVVSHDGVKVPLAILYRKGLELNGRNPTMLIGYGAYGISYGAGYNVSLLAWFERGGVVALANVRGSGAFGEEWHLAGFKATKSNTWKDGIAAARYLIDEKYTSAATLGVWGGSAGGIFVGRAVTSAPELFAAAIFDVGVLDTIRAEESANGITNVSEFGSVKNASEFPALLEMSTYHQIRDGVDYPAVLLVHGMNDPRVDVWHSAKAAARLQAASRSGKPVLLRLDGQAGHGIGSTLGQSLGKQADVYSFLLWQFGLAKLGPPASAGK